MLSEQVALFGRTDKRQEMPCFESYVATRESYVATRESYVATRESYVATRESYVACLESQLRHLQVTTTPLASRVQQSQNGFDISFKRKIKLNDDKTCVIFA